MEMILETVKLVVVNFTKWKDKEYPCKWFDKYGKHNSNEWFTIEELYEMFRIEEQKRLDSLKT